MMYMTKVLKELEKELLVSKVTSYVSTWPV